MFRSLAYPLDMWSMRLPPPPPSPSALALAACSHHPFLSLDGLRVLCVLRIGWATEIVPRSRPLVWHGSDSRLLRGSVGTRRCTRPASVGGSRSSRPLSRRVQTSRLRTWLAQHWHARAHARTRPRLGRTRKRLGRRCGSFTYAVDGKGGRGGAGWKTQGVDGGE